MLQRPVAAGALTLFALLLVLYSFSIGLRATRGASITGDEPFYLLTTQSILQDGDLDLRQQYERQSYRSFFDHPDGLWKQSVPRADGRLVSPHEPLLSVFLVPGFGLGGLLGAQVQLTVVAAATFALTFVLVAGETRALPASWLATAAVAVSATAFVYATEVYPEMPAALCVVAVLLVLRRRELRQRDALFVAGLLTLLAWLGMKYVPLGAVAGLWALWRCGRQARLTFLAACALSAAVYVYLHLVIFGSLTAYSANTVYEGAPAFDVLRSHIEFPRRSYRLWGLFIDERFGIGRWAPVFLLVPPALPLLLRSGRLGALAGVLIGVQLLVATFVAVTMMGYWFPGRMLVVVMPLFALVLAQALTRLPRLVHVLAVVLGVYSATVTAALVRAARDGEVTIAVDPFDMHARLFTAMASLFPNYVQWTVETNLLTAGWLLAGAVLLAMTLRLVWREGRHVSSARGPVAPGGFAPRRPTVDADVR
ncbi:MAG: hypothetical protein EPO16_07515 [Dehalococcoidia bacterium]|nr:MAG: hypothetical protein EPO16_07515 [Dehalococcoidia bacterium]